MRREFKILLIFLSRFRKRYVFGIAALLVCDGVQLTVPWILGRFIDAARAGTLDSRGLWMSAGAIVALAALTALLRFVWRIYVFGTARYVEFDLRDRLFKHLQTLSANFYNRNKTGDLMAYATNDLQAVRSASGEGVLMFADSFILSISTLALMITTIDWRLTLLGLLPLPFLAINASFFSRLIHDRFKLVQAAFGKLSDRVQENIAGMRVVKAFVQEEAEIENFTRDNEDYIHKNLRLIRIWGMLDPMINLLAGLGFVITLGYGGQLVLLGAISLGDFVAFNSYLGMLIWPMIAIGWVVNLIQRGTASMGRIQAILDEKPDVADAPGARVPDPWRGRVELRNLTFRYGDTLPPALSGLNLAVEPGQTLGIIGRTGSGKSTLSNLLVRVYNPSAGQILIDGQDVNLIPLEDLRSQIGYVPQESFLFSKTIRENIAFTPGSWTDEEVLEASRAAQVDEDIREFHSGYDTLLGERGVTLSGGQRQRVGIARALLKDPPVLILDDCLSAVDTSTEARILANLRPIMKDRTTILISHRVSAVKQADQIIFLEGGRIRERGTHEELLDLEGEYWRLYQMQQLEDAIAQIE